jgi:hypothetical protein
MEQEPTLDRMHCGELIVTAPVFLLDEYHTTVPAGYVPKTFAVHSTAADDPTVRVADVQETDVEVGSTSGGLMVKRTGAMVIVAPLVSPKTAQ